MSRRPLLMHVTTVDLSLRWLLAAQLVAYGDAGFEVIGVSAPGPGVTELDALGIAHSSVPGLSRDWTPLSDVRALAGLTLLFRRARPTIVHTHNPKSGVIGRLAARAAGVPIIVNTVHGLYAHPDLPPLKRAIADRSERWAMHASHHEFFQSEEDLERSFAVRAVEPGRASWLGNGVDLERFDTAHVAPEHVAAIRSGWGVGADAVVVGTVGRLVVEKGYREFFDAARLVRAKEPRAVFVAVGPWEAASDGGLSRDEVETARREGIIFHGAATPEEMPAIYAAMDLFVLASYREGMPRSAIEASAMRRAVVATNIRGSREVVVDGETGSLVEARDAAALSAAVSALLDDPARARAMGERGHARAAERFDEGAVIARTLAVYERLMRARAIPWPG